MGLKPIPIQWGGGSNPPARTITHKGEEHEKEESFGSVEPSEAWEETINDGSQGIDSDSRASDEMPGLLPRDHLDLQRVGFKVIISLYRGFHLYIALQGDSQYTNVGYFACSGWSCRVLLAMFKYICDKLGWTFELEGEREFIKWLDQPNPWPPYHETK